MSIQKLLEKRPMNAEEIAKIIFRDLKDQDKRLEYFVTLVELATCAKKDDNSGALLPARYHLFVKSLEGMFISLYPRKDVYLERKQSIFNDTGKVAVFELANCQNCGQEYLVGRIVDGKLELPLDTEPRDYFIISSEEDVEDYESYDEFIDEWEDEAGDLSEEQFEELRDDNEFVFFVEAEGGTVVITEVPLSHIVTIDC